MHRNKEVIAINLKSEEGRDIVRRLMPRYDVVVENFKPGALEKWGLGYDDIARDHPELILVRISGYGQDGPYSRRPGYGVTSEAVGGVRHVTGDPDRPPARVAVSLTDYVAGLYGAFGAVMALNQRHSTGKGQVVDAALYEAAFSLMEPYVPAYAQLGHIANRAGSRLPGHTPNNLYPTADGNHIHIAAGARQIFARLAKAMGQDELIEDARFATPEARAENENAIDALIAEWTGSQPLATAEATLIEAEVPAARAYTMADIFADPHYQERGMLAEVPDSVLGTITMPGVVPRLSASPGTIRWAGRESGADSRRILEEVAELSPEEIERLEADGIVHCGVAKP
jgi:crotonobetainyl-CoA:carnitine CoA-transferase CaiB-like acyl-CoA transferase